MSLSLEDVPELMADSPAEAERRVDQAIEALHLSIRDIRNFIYGLRPEAVDGKQVVAGIAALAQEVREGSLVDVVATLDPAADPGLDEDRGIELLSLVREALSNASRHAHARRIDVLLGRTENGSLLEIADDGVGFEPARVVSDGHDGLVNMRARAQAVGGRLEIDSQPGAGTRIRLTIPAAAA